MSEIIRETQLGLEISGISDPILRSTQLGLEISGTGNSIRSTQLGLELSAKGQEQLRTTQLGFEISVPKVATNVFSTQVGLEISISTPMTPKIIPSVRSFNIPISLKTGQTSGFRYRGIRHSKSFVTLIESFISDLISLKRRILLINPFNINSPILINNLSPGAGIYGLGNQDSRQDKYIDGIQKLQPSLVFSNIVEIQYLRTQINFRLSNLI